MSFDKIFDLTAGVYLYFYNIHFVLFIIYLPVFRRLRSINSFDLGFEGEILRIQPDGYSSIHHCLLVE